MYKWRNRGFLRGILVESIAQISLMVADIAVI